MFTGIIETVGVLKTIENEKSNRHLFIESTLSNSLKPDQSVSHNGVCLTITKIENDGHWVTLVHETLRKSTLVHIQAGGLFNLERCMPATGRFDGHIVQGHIDQIGVCTKIQDQNGSWLFDFEYDASLGNVTVEKGSICINGVSLTCFNSKKNQFTVAIIPYTFEHTTFRNLRERDKVNLEFDIVGKYIKKLLSRQV